jgi:ribosomal protein S18 acetylase RimI-like enzyme
MTTGAALVSLRTFDEPPAAALHVVDAGLDAHNQAAAPLADVRPLATIASLPSGEVIGGAVGRTWGGCCELLQLWVHPEHRGLGTASRLLEEFERRGGARGCHTFYLTTLSFQAPEFYRKRGYSVVAHISGYPEGIARYLMQRQRPADAADATPGVPRFPPHSPRTENGS